MIFKKEKDYYKEDYNVINHMRSLAIDMIHEANSGHPGICLGAATILYTLYSRHMEIDLDNIDWYNRDRFILSAGHGAPLYYAMLYMLGKLSLSDIQNLRQLGSITPGHPEITTPMVDMATGPLGQGIASSVGMAIAERYLNATYNKTLIDHYTYVLCGDGDLMEGVSYEALSLAAKLKLNKLIILYDNNDVTLDGRLDMSQVEDVITRFKALHFNVFVVDGESIRDVDGAITRAKEEDMPSIIICKTVIGKYSSLEGTNKVHGKPLEDEDILNVKEKLGVSNIPFEVPEAVINYFQKMVKDRMYIPLREWKRRYGALKEKNKDKLDTLLNNENTIDIKKLQYEYEKLSLRDISGNILNAVSEEFPLLIGGSSDLSSSCKTFIKSSGLFDSEDYSGKNIAFGIREHAMGAILNGLALSNLRPFGSTFMVFSDYLRPAIRMSAIMNLPVLYIFTHDSITVGEDGVTHQPIEQIASLDLIPNLYLYRPYDANELFACYREIFKEKKPCVLSIPRDNKNLSPDTKRVRIKDGAYILKQEKTKKFITLIGNGEELGLIIKTSENLNKMGYDTRIVSIPCMKNFIESNNNSYIPNNRVVAITYGVKEYYYRFTKNVIGLDTFGISAKKEDVLKHFGLDEEQVLSGVLQMVGGKK